MEDQPHQAPPPTPPPQPQGPQPIKMAPDQEKNNNINTRHMSRPNNTPRGIIICTAIILILSGITIFTLWFIYHPKNPSFTIVGAAVYALILTPSPLSSISTSMQFNILIKNPNKRVSIFYDRLTTFISYHDQTITPPFELPPVFQEKQGTVALSPVIGGGNPVPVSAEALNGLSLDVEGYGVMQLGVVVVGKLRWKIGLFTTGKKSVHVRCDVAVSVKNGSYGQVPLLPSPNSCHVNV
ncbi:NDR1/HIN1-like protein 1 [Impatiens glandulifera]|uniref:NDR1/HIN1-like protein 1 n=1 Tax=Impatiens glandulifera TaxID=253017 RepID=UPI001FB0D60D|nr:NDR1/HIN1-like protein 1 [Impatiens glandulifera]